MVDDWNKSLEENISRVRQYNESVVERYKAGELHAEAVQGAFLPLPKKLKVPSQSWARYWRSKWGWSMLTRGSNEQEWLGYNHPDMKLSRDSFQEMIESGCHPGLILNFDQLWRACWATSKFKLAYKPRGLAGERSSKQKAGPRLDKKVHSVKGSRRSMTVAC